MRRTAPAAPAGALFASWLQGEMRRHRRPSAAALAVGCEEAFLGSHLLEYSRAVTVLDTSGGQLAQLGRRFPEIAFLPHHPASPLPFAANSFDLVWCCEFLDRVFNPAATLRELWRVLAPGGRLFLTVPAAGSAGKGWGAQASSRGPFAPANPRIHEFTRRELTDLAQASGLDEVKFGASGTARNSAGNRALFMSATKFSAGARWGATKRRSVAPAPRGDDVALAARSRAA